MTYMYCLSIELKSESVNMSQTKASKYYANEEERVSLERQDHMQTTNHVANKTPFNTGMVVNRIFSTTINGELENIEKMR